MMFMARHIGIYSKFSVRPVARTIRFNSTSSNKSTLNWVEYFNLKKQNHRFNAVSSAFTGVGGASMALWYLGNIEIDVEGRIMGFDSTMVMAGVVIAAGSFGYLLGPFIGTAAFNLKNKAVLEPFKLKDKVFLQRVKANRVDPSANSFSNPVPDYYGEKIYSLKDYRQWLRDCNAFRRKLKEFI